MRRAINAGQKELRRQAILAIALAMFKERSYEAISMSEVAQVAGLAKGTLYLYFTTKEELFLAVQAQQFAEWFAAIDDGLRAMPEADEAATVELFTLSLVERPAFLRLLAITHVTLEQNVALNAIIGFKRGLRDQLLATGALLAARLRLGPPERGVQLLVQIYALVIGTQGLSDLSPPVHAALAAAPDLEIFKVDFASTFTAALIALIRGGR
jgi:AcrR family transcriptional regulator